MRVIVDTLILALIVAMVAGAALYLHGEQRDLDKCEQVHASLKRLYEQALFQGSLEPMPPESGFPAQIRRDWFSGSSPLNPLAPRDQPWVDVAPTDDRLDHPPDPTFTGPKQGGFWYNPNRGVFRARVPVQFSDQATLELYNLANNSALKTLPTNASASRTPVPLDPPAPDSAPQAGAAARPTLLAPANRPAERIPGKNSNPPAGGTASPAPARRTLSDIKPAR